MHDCIEPTQKFIQLSSYTTPKTIEHRCAPIATSLLPQTFSAVFRKVYLQEVVGVYVFLLPRMNYIIKNSLANTHNTYILLLQVIPVLHHPPCLDLQTNSDRIVHAPDVAENIIG
jgi:hypothetical protein